MSSSRDQISLIGVPGICLAIVHHLPDIVDAPAPAEAAAEEGLVHVAFGDRKP